MGFTIFMGGESYVGKACAYCCQTIISGSRNEDVAYEQGLAIGEEGLWGKTEDNGYTYSGIYAPGVNLHRSPFGGRNGEYYSEDPFLTGVMAANMIVGCDEKGVVTYMKHLAVNEQETKRQGVLTWLDEQTLREVYLKAFEIAVKKSGEACNGMMTSFNRIGTRWTGGASPKCSGTNGALEAPLSATSIPYERMPIWQIVTIVIECVIGAGLIVWGVFAVRRALKKSKEQT